MSQYRKKPVVVEAVRWNGKYTDGTEWPDWFREAVDSGLIHGAGATLLPETALSKHALIGTLEGEMRADVGDMIIRGVKGEIYPCKPDIFAATYDPVA